MDTSFHCSRNTTQGQIGPNCSGGTGDEAIVAWQHRSPAENSTTLQACCSNPASDCSSCFDATFLLSHLEIILANLSPGSRSCIAIVFTSMPAKSKRQDGPPSPPPPPPPLSLSHSSYQYSTSCPLPLLVCDQPRFGGGTLIAHQASRLSIGWGRRPTLALCLRRGHDIRHMVIP